MKRILVSSLLLSAIFSMTGCQKFLDKQPIALVNSVGFYNVEANAVLATNAVYDPMGWGNHEGIFMQMIGDCNSDDCEVGGQPTGGTDMPEFSLYSLYKPNPPYSWTTAFVQDYYVGIQRANTLLEQTAKVSYDASRYRGEASFLRALYYFHLVEAFGPMPIISQTGSQYYYPSNRPAGDDAKGSKQIELIYNQIISDLTYAAKNLPSKSQYAAADAGRATRGAAWGLLTKVYAFMASYSQNGFLFTGLSPKNLWGKVDSCATLVTNDGSYSLVTDYHKLFSLQGQNGPESLFELQFLASNQQATGGGNKTEATIRVCDFAPRSWFNDAGTAVLNNGTIGYGLHSPTKELVEAFDLNKNGTIQHWSTGAYSPASEPASSPVLNLTIIQKGAKSELQAIFNDMKKNQPNLKNQYTDYDPRIDLIVKPNDSLYDNIYSPNAPKWRRFCAFTIPYLYNSTTVGLINYTCTGFWDRKTMAAVNDTANPQTRGLNLVLLRYADILLLQAEAQYNLNKGDLGLANVNLIRQRARNSRWVGDPTNKTVDYMYGYKIVSGTTPAALTSISSVQDIYNERRLELFCEGQRFFDLVRWGLANDTCPNRPTEYHGNTFSSWKPNNESYFQPILPEIITEGKGTIIQNPGY